MTANTVAEGVDQFTPDRVDHGARFFQFAGITAAKIARDDIPAERTDLNRAGAGAVVADADVAVGGQAEGIARDAEEDLVGDAQRQMFDGGKLGRRQGRPEANLLIGQYAGGKGDDRRARGKRAAWRFHANARPLPVDGKRRRRGLARQRRRSPSGPLRWSAQWPPSWRARAWRCAAARPRPARSQRP